LTVLKRTTSSGSCGSDGMTDRPSSISEQAKLDVESTCDEQSAGDADDIGQQPTSPPPTDSTDALKFCSSRSVNFVHNVMYWIHSGTRNNGD